MEESRVLCRNNHSLVVVAVLVANISFCTASTFDSLHALVALYYESAVQTFAAFAIVIGVTTSAAVAAVPITTSIVVFIIAVLVALPLFNPTLAFDLFRAIVAFAFVLAVLAFAIFAKFIVVGWSTTIATIPVARAVVVGVIAVFIFFKSGFPTFTSTLTTIALRDHLLIVGILTLTSFTEFVIIFFVGFGVFCPTAIAVVPAAVTVVMGVITCPVSDPLNLNTFHATALGHIGTRSLTATHATCILFA